MTLLIAIALGIVGGAVAALAIIAPKTKTTKDDAVLAILQRVETVLAGLKAKAEVPVPATPVVVVQSPPAQ